MKERAIGVYDSGLGGLGVVREVLKEMPGENICYFADFKNLPYGPRPLKQVAGFARRVVEFLISRNVKAVLVACNTASAAMAISTRAREWQVPVIGMIVPAINATLKFGRFRKVGVVGTIGTIESGEYIKVFQRMLPSAKVIGRACPELLRLAEQGEIFDRNRIRALAKEVLGPLEREGIEALVLGCTDFTCIVDELRAVISPQIVLIDPATEVAKTVSNVLQEKGWRHTEGGHISFFASGEGPKGIEDFAKKVFDIYLREISLVNGIT